jgi:hypothetical protein
VSKKVKDYLKGIQRWLMSENIHGNTIGKSGGRISAS